MRVLIFTDVNAADSAMLFGETLRLATRHGLEIIGIVTSRPERFRFALRPDDEEALVRERQVSGDERHQQHEPDRGGRTHSGPVQVVSALTIASRHSVISPPGSTPSTSTAVALIDSTARTSKVLTIGRLSVGSSKYITLTTRR